MRNKIENKIKTIFFIGITICIFIVCSSKAQTVNNETKGSEYQQLQKNLAKGWNTWDNNSVLTHVLLPEGLAISLKLKDLKSQNYLNEALIGRRGNVVETIQPIAHTFDGAYTELNLQWSGIEIKVQSAVVDNDQVILVTPLNANKSNGPVLVEPSILWGNEGTVTKNKDCFYAYFPQQRIDIFVNGSIVNDENPCQPNDLNIALSLDSEVGISSGKNRDLNEIKKIIENANQQHKKTIESYGEAKETYDAIQTVLAWNVIYDPSHQRVIVPVSRIWNVWYGGYVLFCWDTYFSSYMLSLGDKELAYANAVEVTKAVDILGFVPNHNQGNDLSADHSQPPIGSMIVNAIYNRYHEKWFLREVYYRLLTWNRWWPKNRDIDGYLCWGSTPYPGMERSVFKASGKQRAMWESGLDNSPMYDEAIFDSVKTHMLQMADVGLMSMYIADCDALASIANELGKTTEANELKDRGDKYRKRLNSLWDEKSGIYLNKDLVTGKLSHHLSSTNFYPLLAKAPTLKQAERMMKEHFYNPDEFWGKYIMLSIARNDAAFKDNNYWRGRIWGPMNFLVYLGMLNYDLPEAKADLIRKSNELLMKQWLTHRYVYENYNSITGQGDDVGNSDKFYHWGALLGFMKLIDKGSVGSTK